MMMMFYKIQHKSARKSDKNDDDACDDDEIEHKSVIKCDEIVRKQHKSVRNDGMMMHA